MGEGTGIVHIAPGAGRDDFELGVELGLAVLTPVDEAGRFYPEYGWLAGLVDRRVGRPDHRGPARARAAARRADDHARLPALLALRHAADLPRLRRLVHLRRRRAPADARRQPDDRVDAAAVRQADGRLAAQHGRLEHLAAALLRPAAAVLPVLVRAPERHRVEGRARGARGRRDRGPRGAAPPVDRPRADLVRGVRRGGLAGAGGRRRLAGRRDRAVLDARVEEPRVDPRGLRDGRLARALEGRPARPCVLGAVVPGGLGHGDARADPAVVLLAVLHVDRADRATRRTARS